MSTPDATALLQAWERGAAQPAAVRALLLLQAAAPQAEPGALAELSVGHRDAELMALREQLFGSRVECLSHCPACGEAAELRFDLADVRVAHAEPGAWVGIEFEGGPLRFRAPNSNDLLALRDETDAAAARERLLARCLVNDGGKPSPQALATLAPERLDQHFGELDPQADVVLDVTCPACGRLNHAPFEIDTYLWAEVDAWARERLQEIHVLASRYGWGEAEILALSPARRRVYLGLLGS